MVKVEILSGAQAGQVVEMSKLEAEVNCSTGFAREVLQAPAPPDEPPYEASEPKAKATAATKKGPGK